MSKIRTLLSGLIAALVATAIGLVILPGAALAHHPVLSQTTSRPCGANQPWTGTFTARSDQDWNKDWRNKHQIAGGAYTSFGAWTDDQVPYGPISIGSQPASVASVVVNVSSEWRDKTTKTTNASATGSITLNRPASTNCDGGSPVAPAYTPPSCSSDGSVVGTNTTAYNWNYAGPLTARTATAVANPGYTISGQTTFGPYDIARLDANSPTCVVHVTPAAPAFTPPTCSAAGTVVTVDGAGYTWAVTGPDTARVATATAKSGYVLDGQTVYGPYDIVQLDANQEPCVKHVTANAVPTPPTCSAPGTLIGDVNAGYTWTYAGPLTARTATATATAGYVLDGPTEFGPFDIAQLSPDSPTCVKHVTPNAAPTPPTCSAPGTLIGDVNPGYTWTYDGPLTARTATAHIQPGYISDGPTQFGPYNIAQLDPNQDPCASHVTPNAAPTPPTCSAPGTLIGDVNPGYTWTYDGPLTARTATAHIQPGYISDGPTQFGPYNIAQLSPTSETCVIPVTPNAAPTPPTCSAPGTLIGDVNPGYTWTYDGPLTARTATAHIQPGYISDGPTQFGPYNIAQLSPTSETCVIPVTPNAAPTPPTCSAPGTLIGDVNPGYTWTYDGPLTARTATAHIQPGYISDGPTEFGPFNIAQLSPTSDTCWVPCDWNPDLPAGSGDCKPLVTVTGVCYEINADRSVWGFWYQVTNGEDQPVTISWDADRSATIPANGTLTIDGDAAGISIMVGGKVVATNGATVTTLCTKDVTFTKDVQGPGPGADTQYLIKVSRFVPGAGAEGYVGELQFSLLDNETKTISLPSTLNPSGIQYKFQEVEDGGAQQSSVSPDGFIAAGYRGESISVTIVNSFAAVQILKNVSATALSPNQEITYTLDVTNTGAITLDPVLVDDRMPELITYVGYQVEGGAGTCELTEASKPQLVSCALDGSLAPGAAAPRITLLVKVDANIRPGDAVVNQARVRGTFAPVVSGALPGRLTEAVSTDLTCEPTENQVCDLSARVGSTGAEQTTTTVLPTTTLVDQQAVPPTTIVAELPKTGTNSTSNVSLAALLLLLAGGLGLIVARRPQER